jgi:hypothetical protein
MFSASRVSEPFAYVGLLIKSLTTGTLLLAWDSATGIKYLLYFISIAACKDGVITDIIQQMKQICLSYIARKTPSFRAGMQSADSEAVLKGAAVVARYTGE